MKPIRIFIASSNELEYERLHIDSLILQLNSKFFKDLGIEVEPVKWEFLENADKQEEYNKQLSTCDICVVLFWNKIGPFTKQEFNLAYQLSETNNVPYLYVYFKEPISKDNITEDFCVFKDGYQDVYQRYPSKVFENIDTLKTNLILRLLDYLHIEHNDYIKHNSSDTQLSINGVEIADLRNVPCFYNNEDYAKTTQELDAVNKELGQYPDVEYLQKKSAELQKKKNEIEKSIFDCAVQIARNTTAKSSSRLKMASELLEKGKYEDSLTILNEKKIDEELHERVALKRATNELTDSINDSIVDCIQQYETRCRILMLNRKTVKQNEVEIRKLQDKIIDASYELRDESFISKKYDYYLAYLRSLQDYSTSIILVDRILDYCKNIENVIQWKYRLSMCYKESGNLSKAIKTYKESCQLFKGVYSAFGKKYALRYAQLLGDYGTTLGSVVGMEKDSHDVLTESYTVFKENFLTDSYSFIHVTVSLVETCIALKEFDRATVFLNEVFQAIESCTDDDLLAMSSLKLRAIILNTRCALFTNKLTILRLYNDIGDADRCCKIIQKNSGYREELWNYYITMIKISTVLLRNDEFETAPKPIFWINKAKTEFFIIKGWYNEDSLFSKDLDLKLAEINYYVLKEKDDNDEVILQRIVKSAIEETVQYLEAKHNINAIVLRLLDVVLYFGAFEEYVLDVTRLIDLFYNELNKLDDASKEITEFKINVFHYWYIDCNTEKLKDLYNEYRNKYSLSQFQNTSLYTIVHAYFLNQIIYNVLIGEKKYNEALCLIDDALSLYPDSNLFDTKAEILFRMGRVEDAISIASEIYGSDPVYYPSGNEFLFNELYKQDDFKCLVSKMNNLQ